MSNIQERHFIDRLAKSGEDTDKFVTHLLESGHFYSCQKAPEEDDFFKAIDYWVRFKKSSKLVPIQFKLRYALLYEDCPVCLDQPFYGIDDPKTNFRHKQKFDY
jgi:hypothetical protein